MTDRTPHKIYTSFEELENDLQILKLQKQIAQEQIKLNYESTKENLSFLTVIGNTAGYVAKRLLAIKVINKFFR
ncbi:DUF6327 family protein [Robertkochia aurantiaca]|uniref:DUF6327 family protein n=1 Tax=Robertkochia aurantiaca TaxID=2873700 RepID=UPI001CC9056F|nr:DUF6327 family protein [Robertkochia sp. 3YJGBD-33]